MTTYGTVCSAMKILPRTRNLTAAIAYSVVTPIAFLTLSACSSKPAQQSPVALLPPVTTYKPTGSVTEYPIYLKRVDGKWSAALAGDPSKESNTELIYVSSTYWSYRPGAERPEKRQPCTRSHLNRETNGYLVCNSAFYAADVANAAAGTAFRGVLSMGILTVLEAATGGTPFRVRVDQAALNKAVEESGALAFAQQSARLLDYRGDFRQATTATALRVFISRYEGDFDPEELVALARKKLPAILESEELAQQAKVREQAHRVKVAREQERQRLAVEAELTAYRAGIGRGDRVMAELANGFQLYGLVVEVKPPLAYVQWQNASPAQEWVRLDWLRPPQGQPTSFLRRN